MGWFSNKPKGQAFPFAFSLVHATTDTAAAWWPKFGIADAPDRIARLGELQAYSLAFGASLRAMVSIEDAPAREVISSTHILLQTLVLRVRPEDFATPERVPLARELRESVLPAIEQLHRRDPTFERAANADVFRENSVDTLLRTVNEYGSWIGRSGNDALKGIGQFFGTMNDGFRTPLTDLAAMGLMMNMLEKAQSMAASYRW